MIAAIVATLLFTGLYTYIITYADRQEIMNNWAERRCNLDVMISAGLYKPKGDTRTASEFAKENFFFCLKDFTKFSIRMGFDPLFKVLHSTIGTMDVFTPLMNKLRDMLSNAMTTFTLFMDQQYRRFLAINSELLVTLQKFFWSMARLSGIATGLVYIGLSLQALIMNGIQFAVTVALIVVGILAALCIILFFAFVPVMWIILATIVMIGIAVGLLIDSGVSSGDVAEFCVDPSAPVKMADGTVKPLREVRRGDRLQPRPGAKGENIVTGILYTSSEGYPLYRYKGIYMSATHRIWDQGEWKLARDVPEAIKTGYSLSRLICLNTEHHWLPLAGSEGDVVVSDWEEIDTDTDRRKWIDEVSEILCGKSVADYPTAPPIISHSAKVQHKTRGWIPISLVMVDDIIADGQGQWTTVKGLYFGQLMSSESPKTPDWFSDGVWKWSGKVWELAEEGVNHQVRGKYEIAGMNLVTEAETFAVQLNGKAYCVRDFTEMGASHLESSYEWLSHSMNGVAKS